MDYVYCAVFSDGTAKFGRSVDVWKRTYGLDAEGKKFGRRVEYLFISTVADGVRCERDLLVSASDILKPVSRESFQASCPEDAARVFEAVRLPYIFCEMRVDCFGPIIGSNSFSTKFDLVDGGGGTHSKPTRNDRAKARILKLFDFYSGTITRSIFKNRLLNYSDDLIEEILEEMVRGGEILKIPYDKSQCGFRYERP